jgi:bacterioferritin-associated ferredoxin
MGKELTMTGSVELPVLSSDSTADPIVCHCFQVRESRIREAIQTLGLQSVRDIKFCLEAGDACMACHRKLNAILSEYA